MTDRIPTDSEAFDLQKLTATAQIQFKTAFGRDADVVVAAPGRVNLIGEHIDYNDGFVLPMAIERYVVIAASRRNESTERQIRVLSTRFPEIETILLGPLQQTRATGWARYFNGVIDGFRELSVSIPPFDAVIGSSVPLQAGLSSSAALEVATATLLETLTGHKLDLRDKALLCQRAEQQSAGVPCGIMDQFSSVFAQTDMLMLIDCRSQSIERVPFDSSNVSILVVNSNVRRELADGEYAERRTQCDTALRKLNRASWRDVSLTELQQGHHALTDVENRRAKHVVSEIARTIDAANAIRRCDWSTVGSLMYASHDSLRDDFEVSCRELDLLVDIASKIGPSEGVIGCRMTGAGFGGCTVSLIDQSKQKSVMDTIVECYESETGILPTCFSSRPAYGAHVREI